MTIFQMRAGKKVILVIDGSERTRVLIKRGFPITLEGNFR